MNPSPLKRLKLGGSADTAALSAIAASTVLSSPWFGGVPGLASAGLAALGGAWMGRRLLEGWARDHMLASAVNIRSDAPPILVPHGRSIPDGLMVGYSTDKGQPIWLPDEELFRHIFFLGQSGVGKTVAGSLLMFQQIQRGGGVLFMDGKLDADNLEQIYQFCVWCGRAHDLLVINPGNPALSNTYNPILHGDPDEVAARILSLIPSTENNPGADHYKQSANQAVTTIIAALQRAGLSYNFIDLTILLMSPKAIEYLENQVPPSPEKTNLSIFLDQFRVAGKQGGKPQVDVKRLKEVFGGVGGRLFMFGTGKFGEVMNTYSPEVNLYEALLANKIVYVMLPTMGKDVAAANFGKMVVGDYRTAISWIQALPKHLRPNPPTLAFFDEAGSYVNQSWSRIFEQSRSAHQILMPAVQTLANLEAISPELAEMVLGNTWTKLFFKIGTHTSALAAAEFIGQKIGVMRSLSESGSSSSSAHLLRVSPESGVGESEGVAIGEREQEMYRVSPDDLKALGKGECIMTFGHTQLYNVRIPMVRFSKAFEREAGKAMLNHTRPRFARGIDLFRQANNWLSARDMQEMENGAGVT